MKRRLLAGALAVCSLFVTAGCSGGTSKKASDEELNIMVLSHNTYSYQDGWWIWDKLQEKTGIKLNITAVPQTNYGEKLNITVASGEAPDIIAMDVHQGTQLGMQGALKPVSELAKKAPNLENYIKDNKEIYGQFLAGDGEAYVVPTDGYAEDQKMGWLYRKDIFDKHNLKVPTNEEELYQVLKKLKELYPSSYPLCMRSYASRMSLFFTQWGTGRDYYYDTQSKTWKFGPLDAEYKKATEFMNRLYAEELIPPDFLTLSTEDWQSLLSTDQSFITIDYMVRIDFFNSMLREQNPDYTMAFMPPAAFGENGRAVLYNTMFDAQSVGVYSKTKKLDTVCKFLDFMYSEEGQELTTWGEEGVTYTLNADGEKDFSKYASRTDFIKEFGMYSSGTHLVDNGNSFICIMSDEQRKAFKDSEQYDIPFDPRPIYTDEEYDKYINNISTPLLKYVNEQMSNFIMGTKPMSEWDSVTDYIKKNGIDDVIGFYNAGTKRAQDIISKLK